MEYHSGRSCPGSGTLKSRKKRSASTAQTIWVRTSVCTEGKALGELDDLSKELPTKLQKGDEHGLLDRWLNKRACCKTRIVSESNGDDAKREHFFKLIVSVALASKNDGAVIF